MKVSIFNIFILFFKVGALLLGGGYVIVPLLVSEVVEKRQWISKDELLNYCAISQCLPGIIAVNTAVFTGYKLRGKYGALAAAVGMCATPFIAIVCLASILGQLTHMPMVKNIFWGVGIGIIIMIFLTVKELWAKSVVDKFTLLLFILIFAATAFFNFSPVLSIIFAAVLGILYKLMQKRMGK